MSEVVGRVKLPGVRLSYGHIAKPQAFKGDEDSGKDPKYGGTFMIDKSRADFKKIMAMLKQAKEDVIADKWGSDPKKQPKFRPDRVCVMDGDASGRDEYEGHFTVTARSGQQPRVIGRRKGKDGKWIALAPGDKEYPHSGCYVNAVITLWAQDHPQYGKRINASLEALQFFKDGEAFGRAAVNVDEEFDDDDVEMAEDEDEDEDEDDDIAF